MIEFINSTARAWLPLFVNFELQNSLFILLVFGLLFLFKNYQARLKKQLVLIALLKTLVPPLLVLPAVSGITTFPSVGAVIPLLAQPIEATQIQQTPPLSAIGIIFILWIIGMAVILLISVFSVIRLHLRLRKAKALTLSGFSLPAEINIFQDKVLKSPLVFGWFNPKIILPARWDALDKRIQQTILDHEISHIRNKDLYLNPLKILSMMIHFMNPLNWLLVHYYELFTELTCDDRTIEEGGLEKEEYSALLLESAEVIRFSSSVAGGIGLSKAFRILKQRLSYQLKRKEPFAMKHSKKLSVAVVIFLLLALIPFSIQCSNKARKKTNPMVTTTPRQETKMVDENGVYAYFSVDKKPVMLFKAKPVYPEAARKVGIQGLVILTVTINEEGTVSGAVPLEEAPTIGSDGNIVRINKVQRHPELEPAAIAAARKCKFNPAEKDGRPVKVKMNIPFRFRLH